MTELRIRCDGGGTIGMGHVMRCLALAHACKELGSLAPRFFVRAGDGKATEEIRSQGFPVELLGDDLEENEEIHSLARPSSNEATPVVLVDSYQIGSSYLTALRNLGLKVCAIDDLADRPFPVDLLINPNVGSESLPYETDSGTIRSLGPRYALLRRGFRERAGNRREYPPLARNALISLGGSDPGDFTSFVLQALEKLEDPHLSSMETLVVLGPSYRGGAAQIVAAWKGSLPRPRIESPCREMDARMAWADLAILPSSTTCYEACALRLPSITLTTEDNQRNLETGFRSQQCLLPLGWAASVQEKDLRRAFISLAMDQALRERFGERAARIVDGLGAHRVAEQIQALAVSEARPIRQIKAHDRA